MLIKPNIFKYTNVQIYISDIIKMNKLTAEQLKEFLNLESVSYAWSVYKKGVISKSVAAKLITTFKLDPKEAAYFNLIVDVPKMPNTPTKEKNKLLRLINKEYKQKRYGIQERDSKTA